MMSLHALRDSLKYALTTDNVANRPTEWTVSLHTGEPGRDGTDNEVHDSAYVRQAVNFTMDESDPDAPFVANSTPVTFDEAVEGFVVTHFAVWDATLGEPLAIEALRTPRSIPPTTQAVFATGDITIGGNEL